MRYTTDAFVPFYQSVATRADIKSSAHNEHVDLLGFLAALQTKAKNQRGY